MVWLVRQTTTKIKQKKRSARVMIGVTVALNIQYHHLHCIPFFLIEELGKVI